MRAAGRPAFLRVIAFLCAAALPLSVPALADDTPIWVDGEGHIISDPTAATPTPESGSGDTSATPTPAPTYEIIGTVEPIEEETASPETEEDQSYKWEYDPTAFLAQWRGKQCQVEALGQYVSVILLGDTTVEVYTRELTWDTTAKEGQQLAVVNAAKTGYARLRRNPSGKSAVLLRCTTNTVVPVTETKKKFACIHYEDCTGYVAQSSLTFVEPWQGECTFAYVAYKGKVNSKNTVKVRQKASASSRILGELSCGQRVVVIGKSDDAKWTFIEANGLQCFILSEFLTTLTKEEEASAPHRGVWAAVLATEEESSEVSGSAQLPVPVSNFSEGAEDGSAGDAGDSADSGN